MSNWILKFFHPFHRWCDGWMAEIEYANLSSDQMNNKTKASTFLIEPRSMKNNIALEIVINSLFSRSSKSNSERPWKIIGESNKRIVCETKLESLWLAIWYLRNIEKISVQRISEYQWFKKLNSKGRFPFLFFLAMWAFSISSRIWYTSL